MIEAVENKRLKLPIGIQTFEKLREKNCVYVDKTRYLVDLIEKKDVCFLARPRRFGKSLNITTLDALFSGKKELFKGLYAEEYLNRPDFKPSPVIRMDMSKITTDCGIDVIRECIVRQVRNIANNLEVSLSNSNVPGNLFEDLIVNTYKKHNQKVVILIDEYDSPYVEFVNDPQMAKDVRDVLRNYYVQIKANDEYIRFVFITGISKFARLGVFSVLNNTIDISLMPEYAEICGYTEEEIIKYFPDYLDDVAKEMEISTEALIDRMRYYYNGFSFDRSGKTKLYNPFSTLSFFAEKEFFNYWIDTGRSKMIADYMKEKNLTVEQFRNFPISRDFAKSPGDVDETPPEGFLYQCGYLTLRAGASGDSLSLDYPNTEVLNSMSALVARNVFSEKANAIQSELLTAFRYNDIDRIVEVFNRLLAGIPYDDFENAAKQSIYFNRYQFSVQEWLYRSTILAFLRGCGIATVAEMHSNTGRADLVVSHNDKTWVIELKVAFRGESPAKKAEEALRQIINKNYAKPYSDAICVGMAIDDTQRQITEVMVH
jgi:hypothetical protein